MKLFFVVDNLGNKLSDGFVLREQAGKIKFNLENKLHKQLFIAEL